jgi:hypothetical protein
MANYRRVTMTEELIAEYGAPLRCRFCAWRPIVEGDECFLLPSCCGESAKMRAGLEYAGELAHQECIRRIP